MKITALSLLTCQVHTTTAVLGGFKISPNIHITLPPPPPPQVHGTGTRQLQYNVLLTGTMTNAYLSEEGEQG